MYLTTKIKFLIVCILFFLNIAIGQNQTIDDLLVTLQTNQKNDSLRVNTLNDLAWELTRIDEEKALKYAAEAKKISEQILYFKGNATSKTRIGTIYTNQNKLKKAENIFLEVLSIEQNIGHTYGTGRAQNQLGRIYTLQKQSEKAIAYYLAALENFKSLKLKYQMASINNNIGVLYNNTGAYDKALEYYFEVLEIRKELDDESETAYSLSNIGALYINLEMYPSAIKYLMESKLILEEFDRVYELTDVYMNLGIAYFKMNKIALSLEYTKKSALLNDELGLEKKNVVLYNMMAAVYYVENKLNEATSYYEKSLVIIKKYNLTEYLAEAYCNLGNIEFRKELYESAVDYYTDALELAAQSSNVNVQIEAYGNLALSHTELKEFDKALSFKNQFVKLKESMFDTSKRAIITKANFQEEQMELNSLAKDKVITQQELDNSKIKNYALSIGFFLLILLLIAIIRGSKQKRKADMAIIDKQKVSELLKNQEMKSINAMIEGQESERQRIARDLHDRLGSILSMVKVHFKSVEENIEELKSSNIKQYEKANELLDNACDEVRKISHDMASGVLTKFGLVAALEDLKETLEESNQIEVEFIAHGLNNRLDNDVEITIYRIIQELISNILKYAKAKNITIQLVSRENQLNISVEDDGVGFDVNDKKNRGMGLKNVATRVESLDGELHIDSMINKGTSISIDIPIKEI
ncbi:Oxygen sensor histidine kinase NreB [Kordia antarctica]|uniref:Oxygen sensor histidine kinase NreB n=1 Tax=Kordia antarctica TaxID=1218801 RepID=A0A7L4ZIK6_9FLAO|nr:sensor histidine kinase [Kordia antarctica]QHI36435.1 Oxygen sensor histidine kinase NreB [Kordia antarctica]